MRARSILAAGIFLGAPGSWFQGPQVPRFEVDPLWPKPLPNRWLLGSATGVAVDERDHVFVVHRTDSFNRRTEIGLATNPPTGECCAPAPNVLEFDAAGNLVGHWKPAAGAGYVWPEVNSGIALDASGNVWIGGAGAADTRILKVTRDGRFIAQFDGFGGVAGFAFDTRANEVYVADGFRNRRVAVIDMTTGAIKRSWGAYGAKPDDAQSAPYDPGAPPSKQFSTVRCVELSRDGFVYVCDARNDRIQVFRRNGTFVREARIAPHTLGEGSVWDIAFSSDPRQRYLYVADGMNMKIHVLDRATLRELTSFGDGGRQPGQFYAVHSIATDSKGNLYTVETYEGKRVQKFIYKGLGEPARSAVPWPGGGR
ncbi:MAG TPA: NHL repeat-containing protein [Vicinamibacterales bacterium]|nr:NHL repeat-containing protein [Vicinamibacterales bacterium]